MAKATLRIDERNSLEDNAPDYFGISTSHRASTRRSTTGLPTPASSNLDLYLSMTEAEQVLYTPLTPGTASGASSRRPSSERRQDEREEREMFSRLEKPRVRYDVEVITKLIVYSGKSGNPSKRILLGLSIIQVLHGLLSRVVLSYLIHLASGLRSNLVERLDHGLRTYSDTKLILPDYLVKSTTERLVRKTGHSKLGS